MFHSDIKGLRQIQVIYQLAYTVQNNGWLLIFNFYKIFNISIARALGFKFI